MQYAEKAKMVTDEVAKAIIGKRECIDKIMTAILARGHVLIEDIPGVGKTTLALAFAKAMGMDAKRVQFTPDVLPTDITGFSLYQKERGEFVYYPGAVMCNLFLADEINRTSAKVQSALLEVMEEGSVTVDGVTRPVPSPFVVIATENPVGSAGTQMLPESQLDRFMVCVVMGYPEKKDEVEILMEQAQSRPLDQVKAVIRREDLLVMQEEVRRVYMSRPIYDYIVELSRCTREHPQIALGLSPRGSLAVSHMVRAAAYMQGRNYVLPDDVVRVFGDVVRHRIKLNAQAYMSHDSMEQVIADVQNMVKKPRPEKAKTYER